MHIHACKHMYAYIHVCKYTHMKTYTCVHIELVLNFTDIKYM